MQLLEREASLASLADYAREARRGEGRLVLVAGEAGVGKSALVERLHDDVADACWSWGACDGLFTPSPLGPLFDLASTLGGELGDLCRAGAAREDLFRALLRQVSESGTLNIMVVEDVHWADEATVDMLRFLGRRLRAAPVLLIATYRDDGLAADDPLRIALGDLATQRSTRRVELAPLSADAVRILAGGSGLEAAALYRLTGGNPFYVTEVVQAGLGVVPSSARDAVLARAARLSGGSREVLDVAALIGARVELDLLTSAVACPPAAVDEILASGLLAEDGGWLRFRHEIARLAVEQAIPAHRRSAVHARILAALGSLGCDDDARMAFTPRPRATGLRCCTMLRAPRARPPSWPRTGRRPRSSSVPCDSPPKPARV
jgi:predicted ATPase